MLSSTSSVQKTISRSPPVTQLFNNMDYSPSKGKIRVKSVTFRHPSWQKCHLFIPNGHELLAQEQSFQMSPLRPLSDYSRLHSTQLNLWKENSPEPSEADGTLPHTIEPRLFKHYDNMKFNRSLCHNHCLDHHKQGIFFQPDISPFQWHWSHSPTSSHLFHPWSFLHEKIKKSIKKITYLHTKNN